MIFKLVDHAQQVPPIHRIISDEGVEIDAALFLNGIAVDETP